MITLKLEIRLLSDAEPATGLGNDSVNALVPTDRRGRPVIPASHLKGLLRDRVESLAALRGWSSDLSAALFGEPGDPATGGVGCPGLVALADAQTSADVDLVTITRTRIGTRGTAEANSLRTVQAIPTGTSFTTDVKLNAALGSALDSVLRLAAMATEALGGGRNRGAGLCRISINGERRSPGELLRQVDGEARSFSRERTEPEAVAGRPIASGEARWFRIAFTASTPICCPEVPINGATNHIRSGPVIPASAVQGALISRIAQVNSALATACLLDDRFRAWPLVPIMDPRAELGMDPAKIVGVRVDLAHRMSKLAEEGAHRFADPAVDGLHWSESPGGSPLKSSDGILRRHPDGKVDLWRAVDLPRRITAHGVHRDPSGEGRRNLFSVEALEPLVFTGLVALPPEAADCLMDSLHDDAAVAFGKARTLRGSGSLSLQPVALMDVLSSSWPAEAPGQVFVAQSPLAIPDDYRFEHGGKAVSAEEALQALGSAWGEVTLETLRNVDGRSRHVARSAASCGVRFGWNRHGVGARAEERHRRLRAKRVFLPGTVVVFSKRITDLAAKLLLGLGEGRAAGFGCLLPHPGIARDVYRPHTCQEPERLESRDSAGTEGYALFDLADRGNGPSPSQISAIAALAERDPKQAVEHLKKQMERGSARHWHRWEPVTAHLQKLLIDTPDLARGALRVWQDLAIVHRPEQKDR